MPAYEEEIEAAIQEGIKLETLVSPKRIVSTGGKLAGLECERNRLGEPDASGRRRPVPIAKSNFIVSLDTLVVAISESSDIDCLSVASSMQIETDTRAGTVVVDPETLSTNRSGVFAGGDLVTGPNTIVDAIAAGKKAAVIISRYLEGEDLRQPPTVPLPKVYLEPAEANEKYDGETKRVDTPRAEVEWRKRGFAEVEMSLTVLEAMRESRRCLRCDLEFTQPEEEEKQEKSTAGVEAT
jgi:NADH-quinone oxidoreductase subunit F